MRASDEQAMAYKYLVTGHYAIPQPVMDNESGSSTAPHRGFSQKARELLIGTDVINLINVGGRGMPNKSTSEFDLRKKLNSFGSRKKDSSGSSPKSQSSVNSIPEHPTFDTIGERPTVKKHMRMSDIGKAHSCAELKSDKRLLRTFAEENIIKMPSIDSDIGGPKVEVEDLCLSFEGIGKSIIYSPSNDSNANDVNGKKKSNK
uniref:Uncharacterized protein n=2 Tax=Caenorhabditis japonica TaxID=281687 RepID=A0A8R1HIF5_CAEJA